MDQYTKQLIVVKKKINEMVNYSEIIERIKKSDKLRYDKEVASLFGLSEPDFNNRKKRGTLLELIVELGITRGWNLHWLLTGNKSKGCSEDEFMAQWPEEIRNACRQLKDVFLSDHPVIKPALISNLAAFQYSVEKEKSQDNKIEEQTQKLKKQDQEIRKIREQLKQLENWHKAEQSTGTGGAASSSTGKSKT